MSGLPLRGLRRANFRKISDNGFGDGLNSYAHTMAWFRDALFVGTTRANLCMVQISNPFQARCWPVRCPDDLYDLDRRAQVWRYDPTVAAWKCAFISPQRVGEGGRRIPRDIGYRASAVFQAQLDPNPALYLGAWAPSRAAEPPVILRSRDGVSFDAVSPALRDATLNTYRILLAIGGRLYTSPTGRSLGWRGAVHQGATENMSGAAVVLESSDPEGRGWRQISAPGFGHEENLTIFEMVAFAGCLYAATLNPTQGFQLWKTAQGEGPPYRWRRVLTAGAYRGNLNQAAISLCVFGDALYLGTGIQHGGFDRTHRVGPAGAEVLRVHPDDSWDLIVGEPRLTSRGLKLPLSGLGPGFNDLFNGYVWRMTVHEGWLYASTYNWAVFLPYLPLDRWPDLARRVVRAAKIEKLVADRGGFDLWRTADGLRWIPVTRRGFGNPYNFGARTMVSTPHGLFVGTANPFGPEVAVETAHGWRMVKNPNGGLEVWLGCPTAH